MQPHVCMQEDKLSLSLVNMALMRSINAYSLAHQEL